MPGENPWLHIQDRPYFVYPSNTRSMIRQSGLLVRVSSPVDRNSMKRSRGEMMKIITILRWIGR